MKTRICRNGTETNNNAIRFFIFFFCNSLQPLQGSRSLSLRKSIRPSCRCNNSSHDVVLQESAKYRFIIEERTLHLTSSGPRVEKRKRSNKFHVYLNKRKGKFSIFLLRPNEKCFSTKCLKSPATR